MKPAEHALPLTDDEVSALLLTGVIMTRQFFDPQPPEQGENWASGGVVNDVRTSTLMRVVPTTYSGPGWDAQYHLDNPKYLGLCPLGESGDPVHVREAWYCDDYRCQEPPFDQPYWSKGEEEGMLLYRAEAGAGFTFEEGSSPTWHPAESMPKWAARIWLRIDEVSVEQVDGVWTWVRKCIVVSTTGRPS